MLPLLFAASQKSNLSFRRLSSSLFLEAFSVHPTLAIPSLNLYSSCLSKAMSVFCWRESWCSYPPVPAIMAWDLSAGALTLWHFGLPHAWTKNVYTKENPQQKPAGLAVERCRIVRERWVPGRMARNTLSSCHSAGQQRRASPVNLSCLKYTSPCPPGIAMGLSSQDVRHQELY